MLRLELIADVFTDVGCGSRSGIRPAEVGGDSIRPVSSACSAKRSHWRDSSSYSRLVPKLSAAYCWAPRTMPVSTRDWLSVQMMAVFERDFPPGWLPFV